MLRLESMAAFTDAIKVLPPIGTNLAPGAPHTYVLAEQEEGLLQLHVVGIEGIYAKLGLRSVDSLVGATYMLPLAELKETIDRLDPSYALAIHQQSGSLTIDTYVEMIDNVPLVLDTTCLSSFCGTIDEFALPDRGIEIASFTTNSVDTAETIATAIGYGEYANRTGGDRGVLLQVSGGYLTLYAVPIAAPNFYFKQQVKLVNLKYLKDITENDVETEDIDSNVELDVVILGCHLSTLNLLLNDKNASTVGWCITDRCLEITCSDRVFQIPIQSLDRYAYLKPIVNCFEPINLGDFQISYTLPLVRTIAAIKAQQPTRSNNRFLKIVDTNTQLKVGKVGDILDREWSVLELFDKDLVNPLPRVNVNAPALLKSVVAIERYARKNSLSADLSLEFYAKTLGDRQRWIVRISLEDKSNAAYLPVILGSVNVEVT